MLTVRSLQGYLPVSITMKEMFALPEPQKGMLHLPLYFPCLMSFAGLSRTIIWKPSSHVYSLARQCRRAIMLLFGGEVGRNAIFCHDLVFLCFEHYVLHDCRSLKILGSSSLHL